MSSGALFFQLPDSGSSVFMYTAWLSEMDAFMGGLGDIYKDLIYRPTSAPLVVRLAAFSGEVVSNHAGIAVVGHLQEELFDIPFFRGVAPNWKPWNMAREETVEFSQGMHTVHTWNSPIESYPAKFEQNDDAEITFPKYYQILRAQGGDAKGGIYRTFLGLKPGHEYRFTVRVNTFFMTPDEDCAVSIITSIRPGLDAKPLSDKTFAGIDNSEVGEGLRSLAEFNFDNNTNNTWRTTSATLSVPRVLDSVKIEQGVASLLVWVRLNAGSLGASFGLDYVGLEDLGPVVASEL
jgi:hypothetical protein